VLWSIAEGKGELVTREVLSLGIGAILLNTVIIGILLYYARWSVTRGSAPGIGWDFHREKQFWPFWLQIVIVLAGVEYLLFEVGFVIFNLLRLM